MKVNRRSKYTIAELRPGIVTNMLKPHLVILSDLYNVLDIINADETPFYLDSTFEYSVGEVGKRLHHKCKGTMKTRAIYIPAGILSGDTLTSFIIGKSLGKLTVNEIFHHIYIGDQIKAETSSLCYSHTFYDKLELLETELTEKTADLSLFDEYSKCWVSLFRNSLSHHP